MLTIAGFLARYRLSADQWRELILTGRAPLVQRGQQGRSFVSPAAEAAWLRRVVAEWAAATTALALERERESDGGKPRTAP